MFSQSNHEFSTPCGIFDLLICIIFMASQWQVGITGGIGAGKSTITQVFDTIGIPIYHADVEARRLMEEDSALITGIKALLGDLAYLPDGKLDRSYVSKQIFGNHALLIRLNGLVHPCVHEDSLKWHGQQRDAPYTLREAALIFESGSYLELHAVIHVSAPLELRVQRVMARDQVNKSEVMERVKHQWPEERRLMLADFVINNEGTSSLISQVLHIHRSLVGQMENG